MLRSLRLLTLLCLGCGATQSTTAPVPSQTLSSPRSENAGPSELLSRDDTYGALVRTASELEGRARSGGGCLIEQRADGYALRAELAAAVRPLPAAPDDLDEALKNVERVELLSAWGRHGDGNGKLALAAFTAAAPMREAAALLLTDRGISLRGASGTAVTPRDGLDLAGALASLPPSHDGAVFVAAEAGRPLREVYDLLAALTQRGVQAVLSVGLSLNTTLPLPTSATARVASCPDGLSATDAPEGTLPMQDLLAGVAHFKDRAPDCLLRGDARGAAGGQLTIAFRITGDGHVQEACISRDELRDPGVSACVVELARGLTFAPNSAGGVIDIEQPITLRAGPHVAQPAVCKQGNHP